MLSEVERRDGFRILWRTKIRKTIPGNVDELAAKRCFVALQDRASRSSGVELRFECQEPIVPGSTS
jgi:hypothetical protein